MSTSTSSLYRIGEPEFVMYDGIRYPACNSSVDVIEEMRRHTFDPADLIVASFPKSGTNWMMALITLIMSDGADIKHSFTVIPKEIEMQSSLLVALKKPPPHYFYSHIPFKFIEDCFSRSRPKVIYMMRNPFDQLVSYYHYYKMFKLFGLYTGSWDEFYNDLYKKDNLFYGNHLENVAGWWNARGDHEDHILYVKYEDMIKDLRSILIQVASFLGKQLSGDIITSILEQSSFKSMQNNQKVNQNVSPYNEKSIVPFVRKGIIGDWKNFFSEEQRREVDEEYQKKNVSIGLHLES